MISGITYIEAKVFLGTLALTQPRILALCAMLPLFNRQLLPGMLRYAICAAIGLVLVPALAPRYAVIDLGAIELVLLVAKEVFIGLVMGFLVAIPFWIFEAVGFVVDNQRGASLGATINPATGNDSSPLGILFNQAFMVFFLVGGGFMLMLTMLYDSFRLWEDVYNRQLPGAARLAAGAGLSLAGVGGGSPERGPRRRGRAAAGAGRGQRGRRTRRAGALARTGPATGRPQRREHAPAADLRARPRG